MAHTTETHMGRQAVLVFAFFKDCFAAQQAIATRGSFFLRGRYSKPKPIQREGDGNPPLQAVL
jgi:hypothetical protein